MDAHETITDLYLTELRVGKGSILPSEAAAKVGSDIGFSAHEVISIATAVMLARRAPTT